MQRLLLWRSLIYIQGFTASVEQYYTLILVLFSYKQKCCWNGENKFRSVCQRHLLNSIMQVKMAFTLGSSGISNQWVLVLFLLMCSINKCFYLEGYCLHWKEHTRKFRNIWPSYKVKQLVFHPRFFFPSEHPLRTS